MQLFKTKPVDAIFRESEADGEGTLKRTLSATALTLLGVSAVIGTGIFVLTVRHVGEIVGLDGDRDRDLHRV